MIAWHLIVTAAVVTGIAVAATGATVHWPVRLWASAGLATFLLIVAWRAVSNAGHANDDFVLLISVGDCGCLLAGALAPAILAPGRAGALFQRLLPIVVGGLVGFVVNVIIL